MARKAANYDRGFTNISQPDRLAFQCMKDGEYALIPQDKNRSFRRFKKNDLKDVFQQLLDHCDQYRPFQNCDKLEHIARKEYKKVTSAIASHLDDKEVARKLNQSLGSKVFSRLDITHLRLIKNLGQWWQDHCILLPTLLLRVSVPLSGTIVPLNSSGSQITSLLSRMTLSNV